MDCPHCRGEIALSPEHWGRNWTCPHCRQPFHAPRPAGQTPPPFHPATVTAAGTRQTVALCRGCGQKWFRVSDPAADRCPSCGLPAGASPGGASTALIAAPAGHAMAAYAPSQVDPRNPVAGRDYQIAQIHSQLNTVQGCVLASAICNLIFGSLLTLTCYGAILGIPMIILAVFEFVHHSKRLSTPAYQYASASITLGIFQIVVGLFNVVTLIMGILVLGHATSAKSNCERLRVYV